MRRLANQCLYMSVHLFLIYILVALLFDNASLVVPRKALRHSIDRLL